MPIKVSPLHGGIFSPRLHTTNSQCHIAKPFNPVICKYIIKLQTSHGDNLIFQLIGKLPDGVEIAVVQHSQK